MYDILRNLYQVSFFALLLQFLTRLHQPFSVLLGLTFLYVAFAEVFQPAEIDRLRRMNYISYQRKTDLSIAFIAMTVSFGAFNLLNGFNVGRIVPFWLLVIGTVGAIYIVVEPHLPRGGHRPHFRRT